MMASPGGGGFQTAIGAALSCPGLTCILSARVGSDWQADVFNRHLDGFGITPYLVQVPDAHTPRAWQLLEETGKRTQVWRTDAPASQRMLHLGKEMIPPERSIGAAHVSSHPADPPTSFVAELRARGVKTVGHEVYTNNTHPIGGGAINRLVTCADLFSPNLLELECLTRGGEFDPQTIAKELLSKSLEQMAAGAWQLATCHSHPVVIRAGEFGAFSAVPGRAYVLHVPAVLAAADVVDTTGCGNAFLGAFEASHYICRRSEEESLAWGAAASSVMAQSWGVPSVHSPSDRHLLEALVAQRAEAVSSRVRKYTTVDFEKHISEVM
eukprot:jgi/Mesvir1/16303/Mv14230-RA.2